MQSCSLIFWHIWWDLIYPAKGVLGISKWPSWARKVSLMRFCRVCNKPIWERKSKAFHSTSSSKKYSSTSQDACTSLQFFCMHGAAFFFGFFLSVHESVPKTRSLIYYLATSHITEVACIYYLAIIIYNIINIKLARIKT